ncbi:hypothetical protein [Phyllobacterium bourgognense]|uniref:Uncharacterized protein n=1 Tax=Phyllobacterium bourgognense TaxID=314236 RepID=A0A368YC54_9HYPH|nr:hypothetical protein [Phyllobacterium bourgognense]RCW77695.1 hypothetical protein C7476_1392 [Phyllobacterium bourgognense]
MEKDWIPRLKGHAGLLEKLVREVPKALNRTSLTLDQAARLQAVIEKGVRDFDEVLQLADQTDVDEKYRETADSLARTWQHLCDEAEDKVRSMSEPDEPAEHIGEDHSAPLNDNDEEDRADTDRKQ